MELSTAGNPRLQPVKRLLPVGELAVVCSDLIEADLQTHQSASFVNQNQIATHAPSDVAGPDSASPQYQLDSYSFC